MRTLRTEETFTKVSTLVGRTLPHSPFMTKTASMEKTSGLKGCPASETK